MSAECNKCGTDIVYPAGTWPIGECPVCSHDNEWLEVRRICEFAIREGTDVNAHALLARCDRILGEVA